MRPQVGLDESLKQEFWGGIDNVVQVGQQGEKLLIGRDFNRHVGALGKTRQGTTSDLGIGERNEVRESIIDFAIISFYDNNYIIQELRVATNYF